MEFICRDTGIGMTEEFQKHIFEPFAQEYTGSHKVCRNRLGMAIARKFVEKMVVHYFESEKGVGIKTAFDPVPFKIDPDVINVKNRRRYPKNL